MKLKIWSESTNIAPLITLNINTKWPNWTIADTARKLLTFTDTGTSFYLHDKVNQLERNIQNYIDHLEQYKFE